MSNIDLETIKSKAKQHAPEIAFVAGATIGATVAAVAYHRMYHPKDMIAMQFPDGMLEEMIATGKGLAINSRQGWFSLRFHGAVHPRDVASQALQGS